MLTSWLEMIEKYTGLSLVFQHNVLSTLTAALVFWLLRLIALRFINKYNTNIRTIYRWRKTTLYIATFMLFLAIGRIWFKGFSDLSTFLGLITAGIAIALKEPIENIAGWGFILWRRPFDVGDRIQLGSQRGDVIDQRLFMFSLMEIGNWVDSDQSTGRVIHIPNGKIFNETLANYSTGFEYIWNEIPVLITFESDWEKAEKILTDIALKHSENLSELAEKKLRRAAQKYMIFYNKLTPIVYISVKDSGVLLTIRYLCEPRRRRGTEHGIWRDILTNLKKENDIDFAYPTQRFYNSSAEGKTSQVIEQITENAD